MSAHDGVYGFPVRDGETVGVLASYIAGYLLVHLALVIALALLAWLELTFARELLTSELLSSELLTYGLYDRAIRLMELLVRAILLAAIGAFLVSFVARAMFESACLRWMVSQERVSGLLGVRFDADMTQVVLVNLAWAGVTTAVALVFAVVSVPVDLTTVLLSGQVADPVALAVSPRLVLLAIQYVVLAYLGTKLGPAGALSVARRSWVFLDCFRETTDYEGPLFTAYFLRYAVSIAIDGLLLWGTYAILRSRAVAALGESGLQDPLAVFGWLAEDGRQVIGILVVWVLASTVCNTLVRVWVLGVGARFALARPPMV